MIKMIVQLKWLILLKMIIVKKCEQHEKFVLE